ncbi:RWP-RK domain [Phytophthora infestans]|uniref:RWP-RK domain n=1 Tax=Phytophthora infestans TaxID=4787 RepID=A0A8S9U6P6_PHYIN|nr:RWP-RK domain [Phytophthora infestans]
MVANTGEVFMTATPVFDLYWNCSELRAEDKEEEHRSLGGEMQQGFFDIAENVDGEKSVVDTWLCTKIIVPNETGDGESKVADGRFLPVSLMSAPSGTELALCAHPEAEMCVGRNESFPISPAAPQAANPTAINTTKAITTMQSLPPFPVCVTAPSTFSVAHPLHRGTTVYHQRHSCPNVSFDSFAATLPTASPSQLASPTVTYSKTRAPGVSPNKKTRKSRVVFDFTTEEMAQYFHMSQREAAQQLGVATVTIKRNCRRLGIVWPYRLMKSKKNAINWSAISREDAQRIRKERALERAKAGRSPSNRSRSRSLSSSRSSDLSDDETAAKAIALLSHSSSVKLTEAGRAFARLPLDCMDISN